MESPPPQETDAWYGSYSGWTMLPSVAVCVLLTGIITWWGWTFLDPGWIRFSIISSFVAVWLIETFRWAYRFFGINYRLTNRRLFKSWGWRRRVRVVSVADIAQVKVRQTWWEKWAGVGRLAVVLEAGAAPLILAGVPQPQSVAEKIRTLARQRKEAVQVGGQQP